MSQSSSGEDWFRRLNQPRRPWLDPEQVQASFLALAEAVHPDRVHGAAADAKAAAQQTFAALNKACQVLRDPKTRLAHLLELERGSKLAQLEQVPGNTAELFFAAGQACREADHLVAESGATTGPLQKARVFGRAMDMAARLEQLQQGLEQKRAALESAARELNAVWERALPEGSPDRGLSLPLAQLEQIAREYSYVDRWLTQLRERAVRLTLGPA